MLSLPDLYSQNLILLECISGSKAYGLDLPESDTDIKGVFFQPLPSFLGFDYLPQVSDERNDTTFYELGRFFELLAKNNPNLLELLATPPEKVLQRHPLLADLQPELFLSKLCKNTFAGYALAQIKKARGLNKKILNPLSETRKSILDFCYILQGQGSHPLLEWLHNQGLEQSDCGLLKLPHARDMYALFHEPGVPFAGIAQKDRSNEVSLSSIPEGMAPLAYLSFNKDGYQRYCKDYKAYWEWVDKRNESRYANTTAHGKNYDSKNMMHTFRLLDMALEIAQEGIIRVHRPNRDFYLSIRQGEFDYDDLLDLAQQRLSQVESAFEQCSLPESPDVERIEGMLVAVRERVYGV